MWKAYERRKLTAITQRKKKRLGRTKRDSLCLGHIDIHEKRRRVSKVESLRVENFERVDTEKERFLSEQED